MSRPSSLPPDLRWTLLVGVLLLQLVPRPARAERLKDLARLSSVRANQLVGFGLVVGLEGTGDTERVAFTLQPVLSMLKRMGILVEPRQIRLKNVAAVIVTAELPPFARNGDRLAITISSMGDAQSLAGGVLIQTPLKGADDNVYAVAQGSLSVGGFSASGASGSSVRKGHDTVGTIPEGALVERELDLKLAAHEPLLYSLRSPDFTTADRMVQAINEKLGSAVAAAQDSGTLLITVPEAERTNLVGYLARLEAIEVRPDQVARVVVNERTGTVILGEEVRIGTLAVAHGSLTVQVDEQLNVSQPAPLSSGKTKAISGSSIKVEEGQSKLTVVPRGTSLADVVQGLNALGVSPRDLVAILQAIHRAGALNAELIVQ